MNLQHKIKSPNKDIDTYQQRIINNLKLQIPSHGVISNTLLSAMHYTIFGGGKRLRPLLVYATCEAIGGNIDNVDAAACAVELIHAYSLVHDDLPSLDNDDIRHDQPACHKIYGEAMAILVGDALQSLAFEALCSNKFANLDASIRLKQIKYLTKSIGIEGMVGGQAKDISSMNKTLTIDELKKIHHHKTGALITASIMMGASVLKITHEQKKALIKFSKLIGLAYQIQDDVLDATSDVTMGKHSSVDHALNKPNYVTSIGLQNANQQKQDLYHEACQALNIFSGTASGLLYLAKSIVSREY